jgi:uncharacterized damage-inducible protein DinB
MRKEDMLARLDQSRAALREAVDRVPPDRRDQPPAPDRWSVAGVLEHLALVDERFTTILGGKIAEARAAGVPGEEGEPSLLPPHVEAMLADRTERRQAPETLHPRGLSFDEAWARAETARAAFKALIAGADGLAVSRVIHEHPRFGALNLYQWAGFVAAHESRHTAQITELTQRMPELPSLLNAQ